MQDDIFSIVRHLVEPIERSICQCVVFGSFVVDPSTANDLDVLVVGRKGLTSEDWVGLIAWKSRVVDAQGDAYVPLHLLLFTYNEWNGRSRLAIRIRRRPHLVVI